MEAKWLSPAPVLKGFRKAPVDEVGLRTARVCVCRVWDFLEIGPTSGA